MRAVVGVGVGVVLLPYWMALIQHPIHQIPIPHDSRANFLLNSITGINYFVIPYGALILALPFVVIRGASRPRLRPLLIGFWLTLIFGLGGTTPLPRWLLGRAYEILTFERFTFWATLMVMPIVGLLALELLDRFQAKAAVALSLAAVATIGAALAWLTANPYRPTAAINVDPVIAFLNRDGHDSYRYLTLGFGSELARVSTYTDASSVDGDYNSARLLPEMTHYGSAQLTNAKFYGSAGMASLRAMLEHANRYGLKYIFVHDRYYEPLLTFAGWRKRHLVLVVRARRERPLDRVPRRLGRQRRAAAGPRNRAAAQREEQERPPQERRVGPRIAAATNPARLATPSQAAPGTRSTAP